MYDTTDRASVIFGNVISESGYRSALKAKSKFAKRFGDDAGERAQRHNGHHDHDR